MEWSETFALFFLFCSAPILKDEFLTRLDKLFRFRVAPLERLQPKQPDTAAEEVLSWVRAYPVDTAYRAPVWLDLSTDHNPAWYQSRDNLMARLNEHRELLRQKLRRPVIVVLSVDYRPLLREIAPDLWAVRQYSLELSSAMYVLRQGQPSAAVELNKLPMTVQTDEDTGPEPPAIIEWRRLQAKGATGRDVFRAGGAAFNAAMDHRLLQTADNIATALLRLTRAEYREDMSGTVRDLSIALNNVGRVAEAQGDWQEARGTYRESLDLMRWQRERLGDTPETVRDLSVSLNNVGRVALAQGDWEKAGAAYRESRQLWQVGFGFP